MLNASHGPAGDERQIAATIRRLQSPTPTPAGRTPWAISLSTKRGPAPKVMFAAHMDTVGLIVTHIDKEGYLSFGKLGDVRPEDLLHTPFRFKNGCVGWSPAGETWP